MIKFQVPCDILQPFILFYWCQYSSKQQNQSCLEEHRKVIFCWTLWKRFWTLLGYRAPNEECILLKDSSKLSTLSFLLNVKAFCRFSSFYPWLARTFTCSHQLTFTANLLKWCIRSKFLLWENLSVSHLLSLSSSWCAPSFSHLRNLWNGWGWGQLYAPFSHISRNVSDHLKLLQQATTHFQQNKQQ